MVKFSCPDHDLGGYWVDFERLFDPQEDFLTDISEKTWGLYAVAVLREELDKINRAAKIEEGFLKEI